MNKKLISFLAATAMIVTVSQESMALIGEEIEKNNTSVEQTNLRQELTIYDEIDNSKYKEEQNNGNKNQNNNVKEVTVSNWNDLKSNIENASDNVETKIILDGSNGIINKNSSDEAIIIKSNKNITIVAQNNTIIQRTSNMSDKGEFVVEKDGNLTIDGDLIIEAPNYENEGMLTYANFVKVNEGGNLTINCKLTVHTSDGYNNNSQGDLGLILCNGNMVINDGAKISGYTVNKASRNVELAAVVVKGENATLTMEGGEVSGNYNLGANHAEGASIQVREGANFTMNGGMIKENGIVPKGEDCCMCGSGVFLEGKGSTFIMNSGEISDNEAINGAGIYARNESKLEINNGKIIRNKIPYNGRTCYGGGIYTEDTNLNIGENGNVEISDNGSSEFGNEWRMIQTYGGGIYTKNSNGTIKNATISKNTTDGNNLQGGAGAYFESSNITIEDSTIKENQAGNATNQRGGGIRVEGGSKINLKNVSIEDNKVSPNGRQYFSGLGGGIFVDNANSKITLEDCNVINNIASNLGAGIFINRGSVEITGKSRIEGNIFKSSDNSQPGFSKGILITEDGTANLTIGDKVYFDRKDDICLGTGKFINVKSKLENVNTENPISITSVDEDIEDEKTEGTKLVEYSEAAGGEAEALKATLGRYFIPSKYMNPDLKIGQSQKTKNVLTYVKELPTNNLPVINATDKEIFVGDNFDPLKDVTATDAEDGTITLTQNNIKENTVDISKPGEYKITYSVTDSVGATTEKTIKVTVKAKSTGGGGGGIIVTPPTDPDRIEGNDRIETSVETSEDLYPNGTNAVVVANAERYTDVLTADPFAIQEKASALLTYQYEIPEKTLKEIERLGAKKIYISGGYDAVSKKVVDELAAKGYKIFRFDGVDRYDTARKIAIKIREKGNTNAAELASGEDFPDALCMTPLAVKDQAPILLTKKDSVPKYTKQALAEWDIENIKIGGLDEAVSKEVEKQLKSGFEIEKNNKKDSNVYDGAKAVKRIGGEDRYETSAKLAKESYPESKLGVYATGEDFPDALIAGNYAGTKEAPVLLVKGDSLPEPIEKYTKESKIKKATIIGGVNAVSDKVFNLIKAIINR
ncbi:cell wall-binding repeat-containing protein [Peptacetobacter sp.]|uniref:cell wall-binding repeat-containing protein n=1 Tax=Peptacetobacter sp. TaxID=2991975 RepID=UPI002E75A517|nr:cell wall-binding repeat-containing protein [Peptacetobacter sp.]MEE0451180.1 cell wall-binding repeat-containing protein [Peptacetobacter sp.]